MSMLGHPYTLLGRQFLINLNRNITQDRASTKPVQHVYYLKVHKCASTTMQSLFYRYAIKHNLNIIYREAHHSYPDPDILSYFRHDPNVTEYHILASHTTFEESQIRQILPADTKYVTILRQPLSLLKSVFEFYDLCHKLQLVPCSTSIEKFLSDPLKYDRLAKTSECCLHEEANVRKRSYTRNYIASHFGFRDVVIKEMEIYKIYDWIEYLDARFDFIGFSDHLPESLVYLRRLFGWDIKDILTLQLRNKGQKHTFSLKNDTELNDKYRKWSKLDYMLYDHFYEKFNGLVRAAGEDFQNEVQAYVALSNAVHEFCSKICTNVSQWIDMKTLGKKLSLLRSINYAFAGSACFQWVR